MCDFFHLKLFKQLVACKLSFKNFPLNKTSKLFECCGSEYLSQTDFFVNTRENTF